MATCGTCCIPPINRHTTGLPLLLEAKGVILNPACKDND